MDLVEFERVAHDVNVETALLIGILIPGRHDFSQRSRFFGVFPPVLLVLAFRIHLHAMAAPTELTSRASDPGVGRLPREARIIPA